MSHDLAKCPHCKLSLRGQEWIRVRQAARLLGLSTRTIRRRIAEGALRAVRMGVRTSPLLIAHDSLDAYVRERDTWEE